ncbi:uncharacterized protein BDW70DRAFT_165243 [Aspergillus foveolatus]|uniref:uncharacterized protein n=1 Tax=Aspergillus foveolatus TaxID=210207 RepID=UPI003CCDAA3D
MNTSAPSFRAPKPKRVITEARKIQNREAQRAYRQRQRERLRAQKEALRKQSRNGFQEIRPSPLVQLPSRAGERECEQGYMITSRELDQRDLPGWSGQVESSSGPVTGAQCTLAPSIPSAQTLVFGDDFSIEIGDVNPGDAILNFEAMMRASAITDIDCGSDFAAVDELPGTSSTERSPIASSVQSTTTSTLSPMPGEPSSSPNTFCLTENCTHLLTAFMHNAFSIGITIDEFFTYNCMSLCSPFYRPATPSTDPRSLVASVLSVNPSIPTHLRPTLPQILIPHHPVFDLIPLPALRTRAIVLSAAGTNLVNMFELKRDIIEGGLVCWGVDGCEPDKQRERRGQPWELGSWKIAPWFRAKWKLLLSEAGGDLFG